MSFSRLGRQIVGVLTGALATKLMACAPQKASSERPSPLFTLQSVPACIHGVDQQGRRWRQLADRKEFCDPRFLALESLLGVLEFLDLGWNVGGLYCNEPPTL